MELYRSFLKNWDYSKKKASLKSQMNMGNLVTKLILLCLTLFVSIGVWGQTSAEIEKVWVDFDVYENNQKGMRIHLKFSVDNMLNKQGSCVAWFYFSNGTALKDYNSRYRTSGGQVSTSEEYKPGYTSSIFKDFKMFIPYDELHLAEGEQSLKFDLGIFDNNSKQIAISEYQNFSITQIAARRDLQNAQMQLQLLQQQMLFQQQINSINNSYTTTSETCYTCLGTGSCKVCGGSGYYSIYGQGGQCSACGGSGKCWHCQGSRKQ